MGTTLWSMKKSAHVSPTLDPAALYGLAGEVVRLFELHTDSNARFEVFLHDTHPRTAYDFFDRAIAR